MKNYRRKISQLTLFFLLLVGLSSSALAQQATTLQVKLDDSIATEPVSGRLLVFFSKRNQQPMNGPAWFGPEPFYGIDIQNVQPGSTITLDDSADGFPGPISKLASGEYVVQAILDHDFYQSNHARGDGNFHSRGQKVDIQGQPVQLVLDQVVKGAKYEDSEFVKFVEVKSKLLSEFHGREVVERAMVVLPASYSSEPDRRFPVYYEVTGFGGTLEQLQKRWKSGQQPPKKDQSEFIRVLLTGQCKWGHHVYANSATNGPRGDAFVNEMVPEIDRKFRTVPESTARFVGGHSSGGWSSLWLQVSYPDSFGGVWSTAPDPVDFRNWQGTDLYDASANVFYDTAGKEKPLARFGGRVMATYAKFTKMDDVLGRGGQIRSFDAVFSPLDSDGKPAICWDRETGTVDPKIVEYWKQYDISLLLKNNWSTLAPKLQSKLHVYMGDLDTFYLEGATKKLGERMKELGSDAVVEIFPGKDHGSLLTPQLRNRILNEISEQFWKHHPRS